MLAFRYAQKEDAGLILEFIKKLADYEKMADEVVADEETLGHWIFDRQKAEVIFALEDGKEVGFALFFHNFSTFLGRAGIYLEDLFVEPEYRGKGYGSQLLGRAVALYSRLGRHSLRLLTASSNTAALKFYERLGFSCVSTESGASGPLFLMEKKLEAVSDV